MLQMYRSSRIRLYVFFVIYLDIVFAILSELRELEEYFRAAQANGTKMWKWYKYVQRSTHVVTRLYLLITVGGILIECLETPSREILRDLIIMGKCVQHPVKGLFVRYFMLKTLKDKFPDIPSYYGDKRHVKIPLGFVLDKLGWKGKKYTQVGSYEKQALIIVNYKRATRRQLSAFVDMIEKDVKDKTGIVIEKEVTFVE